MAKLDANFPPGCYPQCIWCKHKLRGQNCKAYPKGIPMSILTTEVLHDRNIDGDNGYKFSPDDRYLDRWQSYNEGATK